MKKNLKKLILSVLCCIVCFVPCITQAQIFQNHVYIDGYASWNYLGALNHNVTGYAIDDEGYLIEANSFDDINITGRINGLSVPFRTYANTCGRSRSTGSSYTYRNRLFQSDLTSFDTFFYIPCLASQNKQAPDSFNITAGPSSVSGHFDDIDQIEAYSENPEWDKVHQRDFIYDGLYMRTYCDVYKNYNGSLGTVPAGTDSQHWGDKTGLPAPSMYTFTVTYNLNTQGGTISPASIAKNSQNYQYIFKGMDASITGSTRWADFAMNGVYATNRDLYGSISSSHSSTVNYSRVYGNLTIPAIAKNSVDDGHTTIGFYAQYQRPEINLITPTRKGYNFTGWTLPNGTVCSNNKIAASRVSYDANNSYPSGNFTVTANWSIQNYSITYDYNGGTNPGNPTSYNIETSTFTLKNPTREGYIFTGWTGSNGTTPQTTVTISRGSTGSRSYKANWTPAKYSITYDYNGGIAPNPNNPTEYWMNQGATINKKPIKTGNTFIGWTGSNGNTPQLTVTIPVGSMGNKSYKANWDLNKYNLVFNYNVPSGHTISEVHNRCELTKATYDSVFKVPTPTLKGYIFNGWNISGMTTNGSVTKKYGTGDIPDKTFSNSTSIAYFNCGPNVTDNTEQTSVTNSYLNLQDTKDATVTFTARLNDNDPNNPDGPGWKPIQYQIELDGNAGTFDGKTSAVINTTYDTNITLPTPVRSGYEFLGWQVYAYTGKSDYSSWKSTETDPFVNVKCNRFSAGTVKNLCYTNNSSIKLVAIWKHDHAIPSIAELRITDEPGVYRVDLGDPTHYANAVYYLNTNEDPEYAAINHSTVDFMDSRFSVATSPKWYNVKSYSVYIDDKDGDVTVYDQNTFTFVPSKTGIFEGITKNNDKLKIKILNNSWCNIRPKVTMCCTWHDNYTQCDEYNKDVAWYGQKLTLIGDCEPPTIDEIEKLEDLTGIDLREVDEYIVNLVARDDLNPSLKGNKVSYPSGINLNQFKFVNAHDASNTKLLDHNDTVVERITKKSNYEPIDLATRYGLDDTNLADNLFNGDVNYQYQLVDNVGNVYSSDDVTSIFDIKSTLKSFTYTPTNTVAYTKSDHNHEHTTIPVFKKGEAAILSVTTMGYVDALELEFPESWYASDYPVYIYQGDPSKYEEDQLKPLDSNLLFIDTAGEADINGYWSHDFIFVLPLYADETLANSVDEVKVTAYRDSDLNHGIEINHDGVIGDDTLEVLQDKQYFKVNDKSILNDFRDSIKQTYRAPIKNSLLKNK